MRNVFHLLGLSFSFIELVLILLLMFIGLFLELVHDCSVLRGTFGSCKHCALVFYVEKVLGSHYSLQSMSDHHNGKLGSDSLFVCLL